MTATSEPPRAVMMHPDTWRPFEKWAQTVGLQLTPTPHSPGQVPRYTLAGVPTKRRGAGCVLTERELQVLAGMSIGRTNKEIGADLFVSEDTVKTHARRLYHKLGARDRAHAVSVAYQRQILGGGA